MSLPIPTPISLYQTAMINVVTITRKYLRQCWIASVQFRHAVMSDSLWPHGLQHARLPCPSPTPRAYSNSCPLSRCCHPTISSSVVPFSCLQSFPSIRVFSNESAVQIRWPKYWSFSFSPSNEYSVLIFCRIDWFDSLIKMFNENIFCLIMPFPPYIAQAVMHFRVSGFVVTDR